MLSALSTRGAKDDPRVLPREETPGPPRSDRRADQNSPPTFGMRLPFLREKPRTGSYLGGGGGECQPHVGGPTGPRARKNFSKRGDWPRLGIGRELRWRLGSRPPIFGTRIYSGWGILELDCDMWGLLRPSQGLVIYD
jgi:hypothetical protein